jgi:hypothetical protein
MRFLATIDQGVYIDEDDEFEGVHPDLLNRYYGTDGPGIRRQQGQTGAGHPADGEDSVNLVEDIGARVASDQEANVRHDPVDVAGHSSPFESDILDHFYRALDDVCEHNLVPDHLGVSADEWPNGYPTHETITTGMRSGKRLSVALPLDIWWPRAILWAQGLRVMQQFIMDLEL